jgi:O-antigen/teichoic acid export membrane protein
VNEAPGNQKELRASNDSLLKDEGIRESASVMKRLIAFGEMIDPRYLAIFKELSWYSIGDLALKGLSLLLIPLYTSLLTPEDYGALALLNSYSEILSPLATLGILNLVTMLMFKYPESSEDRIISSLFWMRVLWSFITGLLALMLCSFSSSWLISELVPVNRNLLTLTLFVILTSNFQFLYLGFFNAKKQAKSYSLASLGLGLASILTNIVTVYVFRLGPKGMILGNLVSNGLSIMLLVMIFPGSLANHFFSKSIALEALKISIAGLPHSLSGVIARYLERFFLGKAGSMTILGLYGVANSLATAFTVFGSAIHNLVLPRFYKSFHDQRENETAQRLILETYLDAIFIGFCGFIASATPFVKLALPAKYDGVVELLPFAALNIYFLVAYWAISLPIGAEGKNGWMLGISAPTLLAGIIFNFTLGRWLGNTGYLIAGALTGFTQIIATTLIVMYMLGKIWPLGLLYRSIILKLIPVVAVSYLLGNNWILGSLVFLLMGLVASYSLWKMTRQRPEGSMT